MITIEEQKDISFEVLSKLKLIDDSAIIAGGAPRNWDQGDLAKDIDVYLRWNVSRTYRVYEMLGLLLGDVVTPSRDITCTYSFGGDNFHLRKLVDFYYKDVLFQLIIIEEDTRLDNFKESIVNHMDIGINMIYADWYCSGDTNHFVKTKAYELDRSCKRLTLYQNVMNPEQLSHCMRVHLPKMIKYYPDYKLCIEGLNK